MSRHYLSGVPFGVLGFPRLPLVVSAILLLLSMLGCNDDGGPTTPDPGFLPRAVFVTPDTIPVGLLLETEDGFLTILEDESGGHSLLREYRDSTLAAVTAYMSAALDTFSISDTESLTVTLIHLSGTEWSQTIDTPDGTIRSTIEGPADLVPGAKPSVRKAATPVFRRPLILSCDGYGEWPYRLAQAVQVEFTPDRSGVSHQLLVTGRRGQYDIYFKDRVPSRATIGEATCREFIRSLAKVGAIGAAGEMLSCFDLAYPAAVASCIGLHAAIHGLLDLDLEAIELLACGEALETVVLRSGDLSGTIRARAFVKGAEFSTTVQHWPGATQPVVVQIDRPSAEMRTRWCAGKDGGRCTFDINVGCFREGDLLITRVDCYVGGLIDRKERRLSSGGMYSHTIDEIPDCGNCRASMWIGESESSQAYGVLDYVYLPDAYEGPGCGCPTGSNRLIIVGTEGKNLSDWYLTGEDLLNDYGRVRSTSGETAIVKGDWEPKDLGIGRVRTTTGMLADQYTTCQVSCVDGGGMRWYSECDAEVVWSILNCRGNTQVLESPGRMDLEVLDVPTGVSVRVAFHPYSSTWTCKDSSGKEIVYQVPSGTICEYETTREAARIVLCRGY